MEKMRTLSDREKFCLDAYLTNNNADLAWLLSREKPTSSSNPAMIRRMALRWLRDKAVRKYIDEQRKLMLSDEVETRGGKDSDFRDKDFLIDEYGKLIRATTEPKLRSELLWRLSELQNMRKQETGAAQTTHYYLPLACRQCSLYRDYQSRIERESGENSTP